MYTQRKEWGNSQAWRGLAEICLNKCTVARWGGAVASGELSKVLPWGSLNSWGKKTQYWLALLSVVLLTPRGLWTSSPSLCLVLRQFGGSPDYFFLHLLSLYLKGRTVSTEFERHSWDLCFVVTPLVSEHDSCFLFIYHNWQIFSS